MPKLKKYRVNISAHASKWREIEVEAAHKTAAMRAAQQRVQNDIAALRAGTITHDDLGWEVCGWEDQCGRVSRVEEVKEIEATKENPT